jgi:hypothetical protein
MLRRKGEPPVAVLCDDVLHNRTRLGQHDITVGDHRRRADGMQRAVLGRCKHRCGIARVALERVIDVEFLAQPHNALRLRSAQVMDGQHGELRERRRARTLPCFDDIGQPCVTLVSATLLDYDFARRGFAPSCP